MHKLLKTSITKRPTKLIYKKQKRTQCFPGFWRADDDDAHGDDRLQRGPEPRVQDAVLHESVAVGGGLEEVHLLVTDASERRVRFVSHRRHHCFGVLVQLCGNVSVQYWLLYCKLLLKFRSY